MVLLVNVISCRNGDNHYLYDSDTQKDIDEKRVILHDVINNLSPSVEQKFANEFGNILQDIKPYVVVNQVVPSARMKARMTK